MASIQVGEIVEGVVTGIKDFGAFVLLPNGETGLVHISEVADSYVKDIHDYLQKQDKVKVKVLSVSGDGKIGLSIKRVSSPSSDNNNVQRPAQRGGERKKSHSKGRSASGAKATFEDRLSRFMKESDEKQQDLRRNTESKRGGGAVQDR